MKNIPNPPSPPAPREIKEGQQPPNPLNKPTKTFSQWFNDKFGWFFKNGNKEIPIYEHHPNTFDNTPYIHRADKFIISALKLKLEEKDDDLEIVSLALANAEQMGLSTEVVTWALKYMKENPSLTIGQAITMGYLEVTK